jgi:hypothetical protein
VTRQGDSSTSITVLSVMRERMAAAHTSASACALGGGHLTALPPVYMFSKSKRLLDYSASVSVRQSVSTAFASVSACGDEHTYQMSLCECRCASQAWERKHGSASECHWRLQVSPSLSQAWERKRVSLQPSACTVFQRASAMRYLSR